MTLNVLRPPGIFETQNKAILDDIRELSRPHGHSRCQGLEKY